MRRIDWTQAEEGDLVAAAQAGDLGAFDQLAKRYRPAALMVANRMVDRDLAEDVVQEAFLAAYKALPQLKHEGLFGAWFSAIVRHRASRALTGLRREPEPLSEHVDRLILEAAPSIGQGLQDIDTPVSRALGALPLELGEVADLYYLQDWPVSRIARVLGLTVTTVKWRLHTVRQKLRRTLDPCLEK